MPIAPNEKAIQSIREFFTTKFTAPSAVNQAAEDAWRALEAPIFQQNIFASSFLAVMDHSAFTYLYVSSTVKDFFGLEASNLKEKGMGFMLSLIFPEDAIALAPIYEKSSAAVMALPREDRMYFRFDYNLRVKTLMGTVINLYQQTTPLALNDVGYPYLMLAVCSDITEFKVDDVINYKVTLNKPNEQVKVLLSGSSKENTIRLSAREKEIIEHLAHGHDSRGIATKLSISHDTVRTHRKNILEKTGAKNAVHLVRMAVANGWV